MATERAMPAPRQVAARDHLWRIAFVVLSIATVAPLWAGRHLPFLDLPNHLSAIHIWHYIDDPRFDYSKYYELQRAPLPYWAHYYLVHLLTYLFDVEIANKIFLSAYALGLPLSALGFARRFGRSPYLALFAFPLVWNFPLSEGFFAYCGGFALIPIGLVTVDRLAEKPTLARALLVVLVGVSEYFFHLLTYAAFLIFAGLVVLAQPKALQLKRLIWNGTPILLSAAVGIWAYRHADSMHFHRPRGGGFQPVIDPILNTLSRTPNALLNLLSSSRDEWVVVVLAITWIVIASTAATAPPGEESEGGVRRFIPEICFSVAALLYVSVPRSIMKPFYWHFIGGRYVVVCALFLALTIRGRVVGARRWLFAPVALATLFYQGDLFRMVRVFNQHVAGFEELVTEIPLHKQVLMLPLPPLGDPEVNVNAFNQWASHVQILHGGYNYYNFNEGFPLRYRTRLMAPPWDHPESFKWDFYAGSYDYFLTHNEGVRYSLFEPLAREGKVVLVRAIGPWKLWRKVEPFAPEKTL